MQMHELFVQDISVACIVSIYVLYICMYLYKQIYIYIYRKFSLHVCIYVFLFLLLLLRFHRDNNAYVCEIVNLKEKVPGALLIKIILISRQSPVSTFNVLVLR